jgi:hypothetical protein
MKRSPAAFVAFGVVYGSCLVLGQLAYAETYDFGWPYPVQTASAVAVADTTPDIDKHVVLASDSEPTPASAAPAAHSVASLASTSNDCPHCGSACACDCTGCDSKSGHWYVIGEAFFLHRDNNTGNQPLVLLDNNTSTQNNVLFSTGDFHIPYETGPRIIAGYANCDGSGWEVSYFGLQDWNSSATVVGNNNLNLPGDLGLAANLDFFNADSVTATYQSEIHNAEVNYFFAGGEHANLLVGFRYFHLDEHFNLLSTDNQTGSSQYDIQSDNNLFGGQVGLRLASHTSGRWDWDVTGKAGVYGNAARQSQTVGDFSGFVLRDTTTNGGQVAFIGDIGANLVFHMTDHWSLRGGYNVMWVEGVALAPNQLDFTDTPTSGTELRSTGGVFFHGANAGVVCQW